MDTIRALNTGYRLVDGEGCEHAMKVRETLQSPSWIKKFKELKLKDPQISDITSNAIMGMRYGNTNVEHAITSAMEAVQTPPVVEHSSDLINTLMGNGIRSPKKLDTSAASKVKQPSRPLHIVESPAVVKPAVKSQGFLKNLTQEQKIYGGMSLLIAGMSAFGAVNALAHSVRTDEQGEKHIQWSNVGIGVFSAALAAGSAFAAHQQLSVPTHSR